MRLVILSVLVVGCRFSAPAADIDAPPGVDPDAPVDMRLPDAPDVCVTFSNQLDTCTVAPPGGIGGPLELAGTNSYDTDTGSLQTPSGTSILPHLIVTGPAGMIALIFVSSFSLAEGGRLRVDGALPVGIVVTGTVLIGGTIDLASAGAGARNNTACATSIGTTGSPNNGGAGGGGGGGFQGAGGTGGTGDADGTDTLGGPGGAAVARPGGPLGGCRGAAGGAAGGSGGGSGGVGGGAILIAAATSITVSPTGAINVGGGRGRKGGANGRGGGGGGSGGMILLESGVVTIEGVLAANGGSGGEGNDGTEGNPGLASVTPATGGAGGDGAGGDGGDGSAALLLVGESPTDLQNGGGGGGGGAAGFVAIRCPTPAITGTSSPAATAVP